MQGKRRWIVQHPQEEVVTASQEESVDNFRISVLNRAGPSLLLGAFAILLFKTVPGYWPLILTAFLGYGAIRIFAKGGFYLSLATLLSVGFFLVRSSADGLWAAIFSLSIALSWFLIYWEGREADSLTRGAQQKFIALKAKGAELEKELRRQKNFHAEQVKSGAAELQHFKSLNAEVSAALTQARDTIETLQSESAASEEKRNLLSSQILSWQNQERGWQMALEALQNELARLQGEMERGSVAEREVIAEEEESPPFDLIHHQYCGAQRTVRREVGEARRCPKRALPPSRTSTWLFRGFWRRRGGRAERRSGRCTAT